jgi:hypothetical protein
MNQCNCLEIEIFHKGTHSLITILRRLHRLPEPARNPAKPCIFLQNVQQLPGPTTSRPTNLPTPISISSANRLFTASSTATSSIAAAFAVYSKSTYRVWISSCTSATGTIWSAPSPYHSCPVCPSSCSNRPPAYGVSNSATNLAAVSPAPATSCDTSYKFFYGP